MKLAQRISYVIWLLALLFWGNWLLDAAKMRSQAMALPWISFLQIGVLIAAIVSTTIWVIGGKKYLHFLSDDEFDKWRKYFLPGTNTNTVGSLQFSGLYKVVLEGESDSNKEEYLRFYRDRTVLYFSASDISQAAQQLYKKNPLCSKGSYKQRNAQIIFTINGRRAIVDYFGMVVTEWLIYLVSVDRTTRMRKVRSYEYLNGPLKSDE